ncbi:MAG: glycosyltransferase family 2 protein [Symploca sp. SIO2C1]|nr:glycosyltransferase family 2 protein [Symploca sp. SIO2C1]
MVDFTVAIPTYNGETRLPEVLERLREAKLVLSNKLPLKKENFSWEVIVVDNNSTDNTAQVVKNYQANWRADCPLKYYFESEQGAAFARQKAVDKARGKFIGFLDDDNLPTPDWVASAYAFGEIHPQAGAYGSRVQGDFEASPPEYLKSIACFLAIVDRGPLPHKYEPRQKLLPPGAGLVVRKQAWQQAVPRRLFLNHKGRDAGLASEDLEVVLYIQQAGWEIWYNPQMQIYHKIPAWRCEKDYLISLMRCIGLSRHHLRMLRLSSWQRPLVTLLHLLNDLRKLVQHWLKTRGASGSDVAVACKRQLLLSSLMSPCFLWKKRYFDWLSQQKHRQGIDCFQNSLLNQKSGLYNQPVISLKSGRTEDKIN